MRCVHRRALEWLLQVTMRREQPTEICVPSGQVTLKPGAGWTVCAARMTDSLDRRTGLSTCQDHKSGHGDPEINVADPCGPTVRAMRFHEHYSV